MNDTSSKTPAEAGKDRKTTPNVFRERTPLDSLFSDFDRAFDALRNNFAQSYLGRSVASRFDSDGAIAPVVDVVEKDAHYQIKAELPGMDADSVEVKIANGMLTIKGEKKEEKEEKKENYHLSERRFGSFQRSFTLPAGVDTDKIEASYNNGVLAITLPKTSEAIEREKKIAIKTGG
jgi:HSP20 family protein